MPYGMWHRHMDTDTSNGLPATVRLSRRSHATHDGTTWPRRAGAVSPRIAVTAPSTTVKAMTVTGRPPAVTRTPGTPSTSAGCTRASGRAYIVAWAATWAAPRT